MRQLVGHVKGVSDVSSLAAWITEQFDRRLNWNDVEWIKQRWRGKLVMTGVLSANDARHAVECGADAIVAPNHGGRQLDGAPSTISVLEEIAAAIGNTCKVRKDGNVRSGQCGGQGAEADPARIGPGDGAMWHALDCRIDARVLHQV